MKRGDFGRGFLHELDINKNAEVFDWIRSLIQKRPPPATNLDSVKLRSKSFVPPAVALSGKSRFDG